MSILVTGLLVGCGVLVGRLIARGTPKKDEEQEEEDSMPKAASNETKAPTTQAIDLSAFPCKLGDVVIRQLGGDEAWLAGALVMRESNEIVAVLFFSPEAGGDRAVLAHPASSDLAWLVSEKDATASSEPPTALEVSGARFERRRRLPLRAERIGTGAPDFAGDVILAEYTGLGDEHLVVVASKEKTLAYRGALLTSGTYDVLPGDQ